MITETGLTVASLRARAVNVELERPVQTSNGEIPVAPLVLIDLETEEGTTGRAYIFSYTTFALEPLRRIVENLGKTLEGDVVAPLEIGRKLQAAFGLLGPQGLTGMAASGIEHGRLGRPGEGQRDTARRATRRWEEQVARLRNPPYHAS